MIGLLVSPLARYGAIALAVAGLALGAVVWYNVQLNHAKREGEGLVIEKVQTETIRATTQARETKEKADAAVVATPYGTRVDQLP